MAVLRRNQSQVTLERVRELTFADPAEAARYLRHWKSQSAEMTILRGLYREMEGHSPRPLSDEEVILGLARHLARGTLRVRIDDSFALPTLLRAGAPEVSATTTASVPAALPASPLLPRLEMVQIEGADVLIEVEEALEQIDLTISDIDLASASLDPAPSGISAIQSGLAEATGDISATLGEL